MSSYFFPWSRWRLAAFAAPAAPLAAFGLPLVVYLPEFYSNALGLPIAAVGFAFLAVRLIDIGFDPIFGLILDRTNTRFGRFRPWLVIGALPLMLGGWMLFMARPGVGLFHLWFWLLVVYVGFSICVLSQTAWGSTLSSDYNRRSTIYAYWQTANVLGMLTVMLLPVILNTVGRNTDANGASGLSAMGWLVIIALPLLTALSVTRVGEPPRPAHEAPLRLADYFTLFRRQSVLRVLGADLAMGLGTGVIGTLFFFYFQREKALPRFEAEILILVYFLAAVGGAAIWAPVANRIGKAGALIASCIVFVLAMLLLLVAPGGNLIALGGAVCVAGLPYSAAPFLLRAMCADIADEIRLETGGDRTGLLYAITAGTAKVGAALTGGALVILGGLGFDAENVANSSPAGEQALNALFLGAPILLALVTALCLVGYPLSSRRHAEIRQALALPRPDAAPAA